MFVECSSIEIIRIMTKAKFTLKKPANADGEYPIVIRFTKDRKNTTLSTGKFIKREHWSEETDRAKKQFQKHKSINKFIDRYTKIIDEKIDELDSSEKYYSLADLVISIKSVSKPTKPSPVETFTGFLENIIADQKKQKKYSTAEFNQDTLNSMVRFSGKKTLEFQEVSLEFLQDFEIFMRSTGCKDSTIGIRMRHIRAAMNKAIDRNHISKELYPFKNYTIPKQKNSNAKEVLTEAEIQMVKAYSPASEALQRAKDMFLFSYYSRGINFIDLIQLKHKDLTGQSITYTRSKTGALVTFKLNAFSKDVIERYANENLLSPFIFDFLKPLYPELRTIRNLNYKKLKEINKNLKQIMKDLEIVKTITYYCARHTFATHLKFNNVSIDIVKEALGHTDINSTISYLKNLPSQKLDQIIDDIIK